MNAYVFNILLVGQAEQLAQGIIALENLILSHPDTLIVKLYGSGGLSADAALTYIDLLDLLPASCSRTVCSYSNLVGAGDFALWLEAGRLRDIRANAVIWVPSSPDREARPAGTHSVAVEEARRAVGEFDVLATKKCIDLISRHVEPESIFDRVLTPADLREWLLIDCHEVDRQLKAGSQGDEIGLESFDGESKGRADGEEGHRTI